MSFTVQVLMLAYNHEKYIEKAIESILRQKTNFSFQLVITDDCSSDNTLMICRKLENESEGKVVVLSNSENKGMAHNALKGLFYLSSEFIAICEGDDYWTSDQKLQLQYDFLEKNKEYAVHFHNVEIINESSMHIGYVYPLERKDTDYYFNDLLDGTIYFKSCSVMYRNNKNILSAFAEDGLSLSDVTLFSKILEFNGKARYSSIVNSVYRVHGGGIYSMIGEINRNLFNLKTYNSLFQYYRNTNYRLVLKKRVLFLNLTIAALYAKERKSANFLKYYFFALKGFIFDKTVFKRFLLPIKYFIAYKKNSQ